MCIPDAVPLPPLSLMLADSFRHPNRSCRCACRGLPYFGERTPATLHRRADRRRRRSCGDGSQRRHDVLDRDRRVLLVTSGAMPSLTCNVAVTVALSLHVTVGVSDVSFKSEQFIPGEPVHVIVHHLVSGSPSASNTEPGQDHRTSLGAQVGPAGIGRRRRVDVGGRDRHRCHGRDGRVEWIAHRALRSRSSARRS